MASQILSRQSEEVAAMAAIYEDDWVVEGVHSYRVRIVENRNEALLYLTLPKEYPGLAKPDFNLSAPWMERGVKRDLTQALEDIYRQSRGEPVLFMWVEAVREFLKKMKSKPLPSKNRNMSSKVKKERQAPAITHGVPISDRKSVFQGHAAEVHSMEDVKLVLTELKSCRKILNAKHNMFAFRITTTNEKGKEVLIQDFDNDGESQGGSRMLHLLQVLDQRNVVVVVTRWYGGIQLGPDRFRHINNATRNTIEQAGMLKI